MNGPLDTQTPQEYLKQISGQDYPILNLIVQCESGWKAHAKNPNSTASGLAQFIASTWAKWGQGDVFDPYNNLNAMVDLYRTQGTRPWDESRSCWQL
ncbi:MAG: lytic transglycosylase domain-containing protein [Patescibacteria group bacterium]